MKRAGYLFLLFIILLQSGGLLFFYETKQFYIQYKVQKQLGEQVNKLHKITLTLSEFQKAKINDHEFSYNGYIYDIKSITFSNGLAELLAFQDSEETNIIDLINKTACTNNRNHNPVSEQLVRLLGIIYHFEYHKYKFYVGVDQPVLFHLAVFEISTPVTEITLPPPEFS